LFARKMRQQCMRRQSDFLPKLKHKILLWMKLGE
jgi:hypothetical protein